MGGMLALRLISQIAVFGTTIVLSRTLSPDGFGRYSYIFSGFLYFFTIFNVNGLNDILVREIAANPGRRNLIYQCGLGMKLIASGVGWALAAIVIVSTGTFNLPIWISLIAALTLFFSFSSGSFRLVWDVPYQVDFRMVSTSVVNLFSKFNLLLILLVWLYFDPQREESGFANLLNIGLRGGVIFAILMQILTEGGGMGAQAVMNKVYRYPMLPKWDPETVKHLFRQVWPLAISGGMMIVIHKVNMVMMPWFIDDYEIGLFSAPMRLVEALYIVPTVFIATLMPIASKVYRQSKSEFPDLVKLSYKLMIISSLAVAAVVCYYSSEIIQLFYGAEYAGSSAVFAVFIWVGVAVFNVAVLQVVVIAAEKQQYLLRIFTIQAVVTIISNLILIPMYGIIGTAWASLLNYLALFITALAIKEIRFSGKIFLQVLPIPVILSVLIGFAIKALGLGLWFAVILTPTLFVGTLYFTRWISPKDISMLKNFMNTKNPDYSG